MRFGFKNIRRIFGAFALLCLAFFFCPASLSWANTAEEHDEEDLSPYEDFRHDGKKKSAILTVEGNVDKPRHFHNIATQYNDYTKWCYVYYGSYPQSEVTDESIIDDIDYELSMAGRKKGDITVSGKKYRKIDRSDVTDASKWGTNTYRYFVFEPIKWRVISLDKESVLLMADKGLDCQPFNITKANIDWSNSTVRSWLNGYDDDDNHDGVDYSKSGRSFMSNAFSKQEYMTLQTCNVKTYAEKKYKTPGCKATHDKVFLLATENVINKKFGFCKDGSCHSATRQLEATDYCKAMGAAASRPTKENNFNATIDWWLRSPGSGAGPANTVDDGGYLKYTGEWTKNNLRAVVPGIRVNYSLLVSMGEYDTTYTSGKIRPEIRIYNSKKKLIKSSAFKLVYSANKKVGKASVKIVMKGRYKKFGKIRMAFTVKPPVFDISRAVSYDDILDIDLMKRDCTYPDISGIQVAMSRNAVFGNANVSYIDIWYNDTDTITVEDFPAGYKYVKIRTFVSNKQDKRFYSKWSDSKRITRME